MATDWLEQRLGSRCRVVSTTRAGGNSEGAYTGFNLGRHVGDESAAVAANRGLLAERLRLERFGWLAQVHGTRVVRLPAEETYPEADAAWTTETGLACVILTADCLPVVVAGVDGGFVGVAHCGWRGLVDGVLEQLLRALPAGEAEAWLGPAICGHCYEVGADVRERVLERSGEDTVARVMMTHKPGKWLFDLAALARLKLHAGGVTRVKESGCCTMTDARFYSYRRDGTTGRFATCAWLE